MSNDPFTSPSATDETFPLYCPNCGAPIRIKNQEQQVDLDVFGVHEHSHEKPPLTRSFHWWVTPLNLLFLIVFLISIDLSTPPTIGFAKLDWSLWPSIMILALFFFSYFLSKRPESFWIMGPLFFVFIAFFLYELDRAYGKNTGFLGLDWASIPIFALLTFGVFIPINSKLGYKTKTPEERFLEIVDEK